jgi:DNA-binding transcriptional MocR family regulator
MSFERRQELIRLARQYDALIITDDVYDQLQWPTKASSDSFSPSKAVVPRLVDIDRSLDGGASDGFGNAMSNGSFSKICGPGTRTGWVEGTPKFAWGVSQTGTSRSGGAPSQLAAIIMATLLRRGQLQTHIQNSLIPSYERRWRRMLDAIETHLVPLGAKLPQESRGVVGGYFVWLSLPVDAKELAERAKEEENLIVAEGKLFEVPGDAELADATSFPSDIRLCFAWEDEEKLAEGIERLARVLKAMATEKESDGGKTRTAGGSEENTTTLDVYS